jgi:hypothetical protein
MTNYSTLGYNLKRGIINFTNKLSKKFARPTQKFIADMIFGLIASKSCFLTDISRKLNEDIALDKTVERLSRNLMNFDDAEKLKEIYFESVKKCFDEEAVLIIDDSDVSKPCSSKLEGLCRVHDGSTGEIADGYWVAGVSALTSSNKQPIPVYSRIYSTVEKGYISNNTETLKSLEFLTAHFPKTNIRALDRGYDAGYIFDYFIPKDEHFIVRTRGDRNCVYNGKTILISKLAKQFKGEYSLKFEAKDGKKAN